VLLFIFYRVVLTEQVVRKDSQKLFSRTRRVEQHLRVNTRWEQGAKRGALSRAFARAM